MKKIALTGFILALSMIIIPFSAKEGEKKAVYTGAAANETGSGSVGAPAEKGAGETFRIKTADKVITLSAAEYITGVVAAEMPVSYGEEALKAQSVAAYSFALYRKSHAKNRDYDLTDSYKTDQSYLSDTALRQKWGGAYEENIKKVKEAVEKVAGEYLSFSGSPALTLYHAVSSGKTNPCREIFGSDIKYLVSVNSKSDMLSPGFKTEISFSQKELAEKLKGYKPEKGKISLKITKTGESGCVTKVKCGEKTISGVKLAGLIGLPSPSFSIERSADTYIFICIGKGHGVGMSQYGAGQMAASGSGYREILAHYYPGTVLEKNT